jgi:DeoR/GlpR family transcriptional regulator of sugar metabolism
MLAEERREAIAGLLRSRGTVRAADLAARFGVSLDTVRRDLDELEREGRLRRVHGGALALGAPGPHAFTERVGRDVPAKAAIAEAAAGLLRVGEVVVLSGGSSVLELARRVPAGLEGTFVVTSPDIALALVERPGVSVDLVGGRLDPGSRTVSGSDAVDALRAVRPDAAVISSCAVHPEAGLTVRRRDEAAVVRAALANAGRVIALATADKLGTVGSYPVAVLGDLTVLVTDAAEAECVVYADAGVEVLRA